MEGMRPIQVTLLMWEVNVMQDLMGKGFPFLPHPEEVVHIILLYFRSRCYTEHRMTSYFLLKCGERRCRSHIKRRAKARC